LRLEDVLDKYLPRHKEIDFITIDVEGFDLEVLESNNWNKYKPKYILIENYNNKIDLLTKSPIHILLTQNGYKLVSYVYITFIYKYEK
jgi:hypothetical protein